MKSIGTQNYKQPSELALSVISIRSDGSLNKDPQLWNLVPTEDSENFLWSAILDGEHVMNNGSIMDILLSAEEL
jgi:hypothetical protein